ncbi:MAG: winged helix-turn-helix domain-containing protein [Anaerolineaceae bacterium]
MAEKILIIEDEVSLQETLAYNLSHQGYDVKVSGNGRDGLAAARSWKPDLILLDVMLPFMDGFEICKTLRLETDIPIIILTAKTDEIDRVVGLEIGADDYVIKPFSMRELLVRIKTRLRFFHQLEDLKVNKSSLENTSNEILTFDTLILDTKRHEVKVAECIIPLKPKEYELLLFLVENRGRAVSRDLILEKVWGWDFAGDSRTVDVHVRWLRSKIESDPAQPTRILTVRGAGYRFEG